jgi:hypothetical protein
MSFLGTDEHVLGFGAGVKQHLDVTGIYLHGLTDNIRKGKVCAQVLSTHDDGPSLTSLSEMALQEPPRMGRIYGFLPA